MGIVSTTETAPSTESSLGFINDLVYKRQQVETAPSTVPKVLYIKSTTGKQSRYYVDGRSRRSIR
jgi:hypothetical protein